MIFTITKQARKSILLVTISIIVVLLLLMTPLIVNKYKDEGEKDKIKEVVSKEINRKDFDVEKVIITSGDWQLTQLKSTAENDKGNPALVILKKENGEYKIKLGPGTYFTKTDLNANLVPEDIQNVLFGKQVGYKADSITNYLPYQTNFYSVTLASNEGAFISGKETTTPAKQNLLVTIYEIPRNGIYATDQKKAQYKAEIQEWIQSIGLEPSDFSFIFTT